MSEIERRLEILELRAFGMSRATWHETWVKDGWMFGKLGSQIYVLDPETKRPVSRGYQEIGVRSYFGALVGHSGNQTEDFWVDETFWNGGNENDS